MIFDVGVFIALDNPAQGCVVAALVEWMLAEGVTPVTTEAVLAQAWRHPATQVPMAMLVKTTEVHPFGVPQITGMRCAGSGTNDVVDAGLAVLAEQLDLTILTTDPDDMVRLNARHRAL